MKISSKEFKEVCSVVMTATDSSELSLLSETLELKAEGKYLYLNTTNKEYYMSARFELENDETFHAAVNAAFFLKLVAAITADSIELTCHDTYLEIKTNDGKYKLPLIFENDKLIEVPVITIDNPTVEMNVSGAILESIVNYNTKQLDLGSMPKPVQKMFYIDEQGCITFTTGACVNSFTLEKPVRVLVNRRLVPLFKLFKNDMTKFTLGYDALTEDIIQTKIAIQTDKLTLVAITGCDDNLLAAVPVAGLRGRANKAYDNAVVVSVNDFIGAINRLMLFTAGYGGKVNLKPYGDFEFSNGAVTVYDPDRTSNEVIRYQNGTSVENACTIKLDLSELKKILDSCIEQYITINFGESEPCVVIARNAIKNVFPRIRV